MRVIFIFLVGILLHFPIFADQAVDSIVAEGKSLIANQSYQEAYDLLKQHEASYSGNPNFDYYLGLSALQSGKPAEAVFALERALLVKPDIPQAQADLGRAYYMLGENKAAQAEFEKVKSNADVPSEVNSTVDQFLSAIQIRFDSSGRRLNFYVDGGIGVDSNINSATSLTSLFLPVVNATTLLNDDSRETDSPFIELKPGVRFSEPLTESLNLIASGDIEIRTATDASEFSSQIINARVGLASLRGSSEFRGTLALQNYEVDGENLRDQLALNLEWRKSFNANSRLISFLQIADLSFDEQSLRDGGQNSIGATWLRSVSRSLYYFGLYAGIESKDASSQKFNERDFFGIRAGGQWAHDNNTIFASLTFQNSENSAEDPSFLVTRDSNYLAIEAGYRIPYGNNLLLTPKINFTDNDANLDFYSYDRTIVGLYAKYNF